MKVCVNEKETGETIKIQGAEVVKVETSIRVDLSKILEILDIR